MGICGPSRSTSSSRLDEYILLVGKTPRSRTSNVLSRDPAEDVRWRVALNPSTSTETLRGMLNDNSQLVRMHITMNKNTEADMIKYLVETGRTGSSLVRLATTTRRKRSCGGLRHRKTKKYEDRWHSIKLSPPMSLNCWQTTHPIRSCRGCAIIRTRQHGS